MGIKIDKREGIMVSVTTIIAVIASMGASVPVAQRAIAGEITEQIKPLNEAFKTILAQSIDEAKRAITAMEFKRDMCSGDFNCWTLRDAQDLQSARDALAAKETALKNLRDGK